jgi:hypothetical protein
MFLTFNVYYSFLDYVVSELAAKFSKNHQKGLEISDFIAKIFEKEEL